MRRVQGCLAVVVLLTAMPLFAQSKAKVQNVPEIPYDSVPNALKLPDNLYLGEGIGVATNSKGHVFVYTRSARTRLFEFDQNGTFVKEIGQDLYGFLFAHAVRVDKEDNIWAVDEGTNMVIKFDPNGKVLMTIGRRPEAVEVSRQGRRLERRRPTRSRTRSAVPPTSAGMRRATSSSPTATPTRASSSTTSSASSSSRSDRAAPRQAR
jgi:hypothetical protein